MSARLKALIAVILAMLSIQGGAAFAKQLFPMVGGEGATCMRLATAALMLGLWQRPWRGPSLQRADYINLLLFGTALGAMNFLFYQALGRIPLGIGVALEFVGPLLLAVTASRRWLDLLWVLLAVAGLLLLLPGTQTSIMAEIFSGLVHGVPAPLDPVGVGLALAAGGFWAVYIVCGRRVSAAVSGPRAAALGIAVAALLFAPVGALIAGSRIWSWSYLPAALALGFFASVLPYTLEMAALRRLPIKTFGILMSLEPVVAALAGLLVLGEHLQTRQWWAIGMAVVASAGTTLSGIRPAPAAES